MSNGAISGLDSSITERSFFSLQKNVREIGLAIGSSEMIPNSIHILWKFLLNEFLQIGENLNITNDEITAEVESFRKEQFA